MTILMALASNGRTLRGERLVEAAAHQEVKRLAKRWQENKQLPVKRDDEYRIHEVVQLESDILSPDLEEPLRM